MPDPGVSLIPRSSKTTKKKKTTFRPAAKKSNPKKASSSAAAALKASKTENVTAPKPIDFGQKEGVVVEEQPNKPLSSRSNTAQAPSGRDIETTPESPPKNSAASDTAKLTTGKQGVATSARKRKAVSLSGRIRIGSSLQRKTTISNPSSPSKESESNSNHPETSTSSTAIVTSLEQKPQEETQNDENALPKQASIVSLAAGTTASPSISYPTLSANDRAILNQVATEEKPEGAGLLMNSFCSRFKGPKRSTKDKDATKQTTNEPAKKSKDSEKANDSSTKDNNRTTTGAPSVQIIDGEIVLQESSVMLPSRRTVQEVEEEFQDNVVEEDEQLNIVQASYTSFVTKGDHNKTRKKGSWTIDETERFYLALKQLGTDFGSMEALFFENKRTRKQLKNKYRKELTKNPNLVEELALNPKYQTELDMSALNIEVDPKRIEAHENEEPPAYEPTDEDGMEATEATDVDSKIPNKRYDDGAGFEGEVVEEDAEEERKAEAFAALGADRAKSKKFSEDPSLWEEAEEHKTEQESGDGFDDGMGGFPREEGPSMDDFFHDDSYNDDPEEQEEERTTESKKKTLEPKEEPKAASKDSLVSLVPKKATAKSRRPKIRPSSRKKK